jgi:hypothetical protein
MANYVANGTYTLPNGDDYTATVDPGLTDVRFTLTNTLPASFNISSNTGSNVYFNADASVATVVNITTNGGFITIDPPDVSQEIKINETINDGGIAAVPGDLLNSLVGGTVIFGDGGGTDLLGTAGTYYNLSSLRVIDGFASHADIVDDQSLSITSFTSYSVSAQNVSGVQTIILNTSNNSSLTFSVFGSNLTAGIYTSTSSGPLLLSNDGVGGTRILDRVCFVRGTRIATPDGEMAVEALSAGDLVSITGVSGAVLAQPVKWVGHRRIDLAGHPRPDTAAPVRIRKGAFAENVPHRDLLVSPDHAIFVDGMLISARQLVNHATIRYEAHCRSVEYFHVELEHHGILLAEGLTAESYLDTGNRGFFANSGDPLVLHPELATGADYQTREASSCASFVWDEENVQPIWQRLADRAAALGQSVAAPNTTTDAGLHILVGGRAIKPTCVKDGLFTFVLPRKAAEVQVVSRASMPTDSRPWLDDRRRLGVHVKRIVLRSGINVVELPLDHPALSCGWWDVERNGVTMRRWTDGAAVLPLPALDGVALLELSAGSGGMTYLLNTEQETLAATA